VHAGPVRQLFPTCPAGSITDRHFPRGLRNGDAGAGDTQRSIQPHAGLHPQPA
jgi:hypothetical protein